MLPEGLDERFRKLARRQLVELLNGRYSGRSGKTSSIVVSGR
jgi:hypothetical protein